MTYYLSHLSYIISFNLFQIFLENINYDTKYQMLFYNLLSRFLSYIYENLIHPFSGFLCPGWKSDIQSLMIHHLLYFRIRTFDLFHYYINFILGFNCSFLLLFHLDICNQNHRLNRWFEQAL